MFKGTTRSVFIDKRDYVGPLWQQIEDAFQFVLRNIRLGAKMEGIYRKDIYELPPDSIRELIINAVMNCSFLQSSHIQVAIYDDRLEITSPGGLLPGVTIQKMKEGYSKIRNKALAHVFSYINLIEEWGSGIPRLMDAMKAYGLQEPEFIEMEIGFRINLYRKTFTESFDIAGISLDTSTSTSTNTSTSGVEDTRAQILYEIKKNPSTTQEQLANVIGISKSGIRYAMGKLREEGILEHIGSPKKGVWIIKDNNEHI